MRLLYLAWRFGGESPYCLFNGLTRDFRPVERPWEEPLPPPEPRRLRNVIYAFANSAYIDSLEAASLSAGTSGVMG